MHKTVAPLFTSLVAALLLPAGVANSAGLNYWVLKPVPSLQVKVAPPAETPAISLASATLPGGTEGKPYSYDLHSVTQLTAGPGLGSVTYTLAGGALPLGISLSTDGRLAGTPTAPTTPQGTSFTVLGTYVTATGQQVYSIKVGEAVLEATEIFSGGFQSCAILTTGNAKCWRQSSAMVPEDVPGLGTPVTDFSIGINYSCAIVGGSAKCWGANESGQLGNGTTATSTAPVQVSGLASGVTSISAGQNHTCAIAGGAAKCWGHNGNGQLGDGTTTNSSVPVQVVGLSSDVSSIAVGLNGNNGSSCAVQGGAARCWGGNGFGQLGRGSFTASNTPITPSGLNSNVSSISMGTYHACAIIAGAARCWGANWTGTLGNGTQTDSTVPVSVAGLTAGVTALRSGEEFNCAIVSGGAQCWGKNNSGQLGNGSTTNSSVPVQVSGLSSGVSSVGVGLAHSCATVDGFAKCWGANLSGQLGSGDTTASTIPKNVKPAK